MERGGRAAGVLVRDAVERRRVRADGGERDQRHRRVGRPAAPRRALRRGGGAAHPAEPRHARDARPRVARRRRRRDRAGGRRAHGLRAALARPHAGGHHRQRLRGARSTTCPPRTRTWPTCSRRVNAFFGTSLGAADLTGAYAGVRPLISTGDPKKSVDISRKAELYETSSGLVTITGGKLTTWRRMAKLAVDRIVEREGREAPCRTQEIPLGLPVEPAALPAVAGRGRRQPRAPRRPLRPRRAGRAAPGRGGAGARAADQRRPARPRCRGGLRGAPRAGALAGRRAAAAHPARAARRAHARRAGRRGAGARGARDGGELGWDEARVERELDDWREVAARRGARAGAAADAVVAPAPRRSRPRRSLSRARLPRRLRDPARPRARARAERAGADGHRQRHARLVLRPPGAEAARRAGRARPRAW